MHKILKKERIGPNLNKFVIEAPLVPRNYQPGQFVILKVDEVGERIPITIAEADKDKGTITIFVQEVGKTTYKLGELKAGDSIFDVVGPLGHPAKVEKIGTVVTIGGGVGTAIVYPETKAFKEAGNYVISIIGFKNKDHVILEEEMRKCSDELYILTDDGSYGKKGFTTDELQELENAGRKMDLVIAIGPAIMMKKVSEMTKQYNVKTIVSLNSTMMDATGMCGGCRVEVDGETKFACVDGPEFDGHKVNFDLLIKRLSTYEKQEKEALNSYKNCKIEK
ncbi:sulfide/dihydroorotate dehydrogenase-like FAD/NAD-binding protein [candidate division WOR-3 bacterium]|nr:sulfide/dihydroorotate dehydrogenase-like FAD/NAD-binding protein [candidate division WOR-3 bacterium]